MPTFAVSSDLPTPPLPPPNAMMRLARRATCGRPSCSSLTVATSGADDSSGTPASYQDPRRPFLLPSKNDCGHAGTLPQRRVAPHGGPMKHLGWLAALFFVLPVTARAEKVLSGGDLTLNVGALLQPETQIAEDAAPNKSTGTDFFLRRARLVVSGSLTRQVDFFIDTEQANLGKGGTTGNVSLLDAFGTFKIAPPIAIDGGLMLVPLTRHALQSAISLNGIDYHSKLILYPPNSNFIWRDLGIEARGLLAGGHLHYRAGIFAGVHGTEPTMMMPIARNQSDIPRVAGHVRWNFLGKEETFFFPGISFATEPLLSFGVGVDYQPEAVVGMERANDYLALASDVFAEIPTR